MIGRYCDFHIVITKLQSKFTSAPKLHILPPFYIVVNTESREKLGNCITFVPIRKWFISGATTIVKIIVNVIPPFNLKVESFSWSQWFYQIDSHHGLIDQIGKRTSIRIFHILNIETTLKRFFQIGLGKGLWAIKSGIETIRIDIWSF